MADQEAKGTFENSEKDSIEHDSKEAAGTKINLKTATHKLKTEALKRFIIAEGEQSENKEKEEKETSRENNDDLESTPETDSGSSQHKQLTDISVEKPTDSDTTSSVDLEEKSENSENKNLDLKRTSTKDSEKDSLILKQSEKENPKDKAVLDSNTLEKDCEGSEQKNSEINIHSEKEKESFDVSLEENSKELDKSFNETESTEKKEETVSIVTNSNTLDKEKSESKKESVHEISETSDLKGQIGNTKEELNVETDVNESNGLGAAVKQTLEGANRLSNKPGTKGIQENVKSVSNTETKQETKLVNPENTVQQRNSGVQETISGKSLENQQVDEKSENSAQQSKESRDELNVEDGASRHLVQDWESNESDKNTVAVQEESEVSENQVGLLKATKNSEFEISSISENQQADQKFSEVERPKTSSTTENQQVKSEAVEFIEQMEQGREQPDSHFSNAEEGVNADSQPVEESKADSERNVEAATKQLNEPSQQANSTDQPSEPDLSQDNGLVQEKGADQNDGNTAESTSEENDTSVKIEGDNEVDNSEKPLGGSDQKRGTESGHIEGKKSAESLAPSNNSTNATPGQIEGEKQPENSVLSSNAANATSVIQDGNINEEINTETGQVEGEKQPENSVPSSIAANATSVIQDGNINEEINTETGQVEGVKQPENSVSSSIAANATPVIQDGNINEEINTETGQVEGENKVTLVEADRTDSQTSLVSQKSSTQIAKYDINEHISKPITTADIPADFLTLYHSFGYECTKRSNLHMLCADHMVFSAGNTFQILNVKTKEQINMRSTSGGGVGAIAVHPSQKYFAVSEKGVKPNIVIYQYPSLKIHRILRGGTEEAYSNLDFSPSGEKLASVGSYPDYMMTIWDWNKEKIILRSKAFSQDVYKVAFSPEDEGHLCSSGTGHIKFWTMANTFTGLKLQGDLGRFGTTELSDISGFVELPDGKVLSGSEWGNMLLWDGGLIKAELTRKGKKTCHLGNIEQFFLDEGEMITVGVDGYVKVWDFESIDNADSQDETKLFEIEPMSELKVGADVKLLSMIKSVDEEESSMWYAQDANGGIWSLDLSFSHTSQTPVKMFSYHAGKVNSLSMSPISHVAATTGEDGTVRLYDYFEKNPLCYKKFNIPGSSVLWIPKVVDSSCSSVLVGFSDGVVRHLTVITNNKRTAKNPTSTGVALHLSQVFKPHLKAVTCMVIDTQGKFLATGSEDGTVFFFQIEKTFKPIGFVEVSSEVVSLEWSSVTKGSKLLVVGKDGSLFEFSPPRAGVFDTSDTFQLAIEEILVNQFKFESVKDEILRKAEEERKAKELQEKQRKQQAERDRKRALGISEEEEEGGEKEEGDEDNEDNKEEKQVPVIHPQGDVLKGFYRSAGSDNIVITLDGWDAGYFYECKFPTKSSPQGKNDNDEDEKEDLVNAINIPAINNVPITSLSFSKNGDYLALGLKNGALRVQNMKRSTLEKLDSYWFLNVHDNHAGVVRDVAISFDNKFLMSVGEDGNIFTFSFMDEAMLKEFEKNRTKIKTKTIESRPADDIDDPKHYSIELEKQKAEHDKKLRLAEEKKQQAKGIINKLRREFRKLKAKNGELPSYLQLPQSEFIIDPQMKIDIEEETKTKIELLKKETAWESEKHDTALRKLKQRYQDCLECDRIVLFSFLADHTVSSFRASELTQEFYDIMKENQKKMDMKNVGGLLTVVRTAFARRGNARNMSLAKGRRSSLPNEEQEKNEFTHAQKPTQQPSQKLDGKVAKMIEKAEQRRQKRIARQKEWEELYRSKPDETYEDPEDAALIGHAKKTIGDFKLKTAPDFVVPEGERVNAEKKRAELFDLKVKLHDLKKDFNEKLLAFRNRKINTIDKIRILVGKLQEVQSQLPERCHVTLPSIPEMRIEEQPKRKLEYTKEILIEFRKNVLGLEITRIDEIQTGSHGNESHAISKTTTRATNDPRLRSTSMISTFSSVPPSGSSVVCESPDTIMERNEVEVNGDNVEEDDKSPLQLAIEKEQEIRLTYARNQLLKEVNEHLILFDAELRLLRHEKIHLELKLKNAELRQITLFEEWVLLKEFEKREDMLGNKLYVKMQEKEDMEDKVDECKELLSEKKEELEKLQERESALLTTLNNTIGDNNKFEAFLMKVFKKKIKRVKKKTTTEGNSDDESEEDESDDDYDDSDEEDVSDEDELDDSVCPSGCDPVIFDQICSLRERRLDLEELLLETKKTCDTLKKDLDTMVKKVKVVHSAVKSAGADLEAFQREKQQKLNELDVVVTLKLDQIQYVLNNTLPQDLSKCLVIRGCFLDTLQKRIKELEREKVTQKQLYKERRQQHVQMHRDKKTMQNKIKELEDRVQQIQMLKFGRLVDLEKLETVSVNRVAEELKEKLREQEANNQKAIHSWDKSIDKLQAEFTSLVRDNTKRLDTYTIFHQKNRDLVANLDARQKNLGSEFQGDRKSDEIERGRLAQLVQIQSNEIQQLEDEINILSRKGSHVLPPQRGMPPMNGD